MAPGRRRCGRGQHTQTWACMRSSCQRRVHTKQRHGIQGLVCFPHIPGDQTPPGPLCPSGLREGKRKLWLDAHLPHSLTAPDLPVWPVECAWPFRVRMREPPWPTAQGLRDKLRETTAITMGLECPALDSWPSQALLEEDELSSGALLTCLPPRPPPLGSADSKAASLFQGNTCTRAHCSGKSCVFPRSRPPNTAHTFHTYGPHRCTAHTAYAHRDFLAHLHSSNTGTLLRLGRVTQHITHGEEHTGAPFHTHPSAPS